MRQGRAAGLAALPWAQTTEGTGINIACSHPNIQSNDYIYWYRQFPGQGPAFLVLAKSGSRDVTDPVGRLSVAADRRSSTLWLARPRLRDAAVYYCVLISDIETQSFLPSPSAPGLWFLGALPRGPVQQLWHGGHLVPE
uniref:Immunoglobulin V-set domain-containing protein n=1 Tax=Anas platyrhynchos TaxID=8839 RepID=A0A8B9R5V5_ANAPL